MIHKEQNLYKLCQLDFKRSNSLLAKKKNTYLGANGLQGKGACL